FESKGEVYALLAIEFLEYLKNEIVKVAALGEPEEKLLNIRKLFFKIYDSDKRILINLINTRSSDALEGVPSDIAEQIKSLSGDCLKVLVETIEEGMDQQVFRKENPVVLADIIWGTFSGLILLAESKRMLNNRNDFVKTTIKTALDTIHRGINPVIG
ncbi:MAG: WHG domain-containing protein, partial [Desulfobacteraceae bacterium]|nr:WHG domain-containing protein [Desulfobacteraceae bacterium]